MTADAKQRNNWREKKAQRSQEISADRQALQAHLDLRHVCFLLAIANLSDLSVGQHADDRAVLLQLVQLLLDGLCAICVLLCIPVEGLLFGLEPVHGSRNI